MKTVICILLLLLVMVLGGQAATLDDLVQSIRDKGVYFDAERFPEAVLFRMFNEHLISIVTMARTNQADVIIQMTEDSFVFLLPSDFYLINAVILNADPDEPIGTENYPAALKYVPPNQFGKSGTYSSGRPEHYTIWDDSIKFHAPSATGNDSLFLMYFALPTAMTTGSDAVDVPDAYLHLLKEYVRAECLDRIVPGGPGRQETGIHLKMIEETLLGRPEDEK